MQMHYRRKKDAENGSAGEVTFDSPALSVVSARCGFQSSLYFSLTFTFSLIMTFFPFSNVITFWLVQCPGTYSTPRSTRVYSGATQRTSAAGGMSQRPATQVQPVGR